MPELLTTMLNRINVVDIFNSHLASLSFQIFNNIRTIIIRTFYNVPCTDIQLGHELRFGFYLI